MELEDCDECGGAVSTDARTCPHCGRLAPTAAARRRLRQDRAGALLLFAGGSRAGGRKVRSPPPSLIPLRRKRACRMPSDSRKVRSPPWLDT